MSSAELPKTAVAEHLAQKICALDVARLPDAVRAKCEDLLVDVVGLAVTARNEDYVKAALAGCDDDGPCTAIGHARTLSRRRRSAGQRHRDPRRGFRRHVRRRPGPCRRGHRAGGAGGVRAAQSRRPRGASRHRRRRRDHVPAQHRRADAHPQSRLSSDRGVRRHGRGGRRRRGAETHAAAIGRRARHRRLDGKRHHRISGRGRLDQAAACRLGGAIGHSRGAAWPRRLLRPAHGVRRRARLLSRLCAHHQGRLRRADRRFRHALGDGDAGVQALSVRDHDASLYRLRAPARGEKNQGGRCRRDGVRGRRGHRASVVGAARRQAKARQRLCRKILHAVLRRHRLRARQCRPRRFFRCRGARSRRRRARRQGALPDRSAKSLSEKFHRPHPRHVARRHGGRGAPALYARRRAGAADTRRHPGQVLAQRHARRLDGRTRRAGAEAHRHFVRRTGGAFGVAAIRFVKKADGGNEWPP